MTLPLQLSPFNPTITVTGAVMHKLYQTRHTGGERWPSIGQATCGAIPKLCAAAKLMPSGLHVAASGEGAVAGAWTRWPRDEERRGRG